VSCFKFIYLFCILLTFLQMKDCHPRFKWHVKNWVLMHISVMHREATRRLLKMRNPDLMHISVMHHEATRRLLKTCDPDLKILQEYEELTSKGIIKKRMIRPEPESEPESEVSLCLQFTQLNPIEPSSIAQRPRSTQSTQSVPIHTLKQRQVQDLVSTKVLIADIAPLIYLI